MADTQREDLSEVPTPELREGLQLVSEGEEAPGDLSQLYRRLDEMSKRTEATLDGAEYDLDLLKRDDEEGDDTGERPTEQPTIH